MESRPVIRPSRRHTTAGLVALLAAAFVLCTAASAGAATMVPSFAASATPAASAASAADLAPGGQSAAAPAAGLPGAPFADDAAESPFEPPVLEGVTGGLPGKGSSIVGEWTHIGQVVQYLRYSQPPWHVYYLFGGSAARESIISELSWSARLQGLSGKSTAAYVLSSRCQTFAEDTRIVRNLPRNRGTAFISVGLGRFTMTHKPRSVPSTGVRTYAPGPWYQHFYDTKPRLSAAAKHQLVRVWLRDRAAVFAARFPGRLAELEALVTACRNRGIRPVLVEMPANLPIIGDAFDKQRAVYQAACIKLAADHNMKYLRFVARVGLRGSDFYDLAHLLTSGRTKWEPRFCREIKAAKLL